MDYVLGEWLPDLGAVGDGLERCLNLIPHADGYRGMRSPEIIEAGTLDDECLGAHSGRLQNGATWIGAGTQAKLWMIEDGIAFTDRSRALPYTGSEASQWDFDQYSNTVYATNGADPIQKYEPGVDTLFADLSADAPLANSMMVADDFLVAGNITGQGVNASAIGQREAGLQWSARGDPASWPQVGTSAATAVQSDFQVLEGDGGPLTAMVHAGEWSFIARERQVWRMDYVGGTDIFSFRLLDSHRGCIIPNGAQAVGNHVYYPTEDGFMRCDGANVEPIGLEKVDITWKQTQDFSAASWVSRAHDPENQVVWWTICNGARPTSMIGYRYNLGRWTSLDQAPQRILSVVGGLGRTMDSSPYFGTSTMDSGSFPSGLATTDMDTLRGFSDEALAQIGTDRKLSTYTNDVVLAGLIETKDVGFRNRQLLRHVTPYYSTQRGRNTSEVPISMIVDTRISQEQGYGPVSGLQRTMAQRAINATGKIPYRTAGRFFRFTFITANPLWRLQGFDIELQERGAR